MFLIMFSLDVEFFSEALERYNRQHVGAEAIILRRPIGMLMVDAVQMRNKLIPSPLRCLRVSDKLALRILEHYLDRPFHKIANCNKCC